MVSIVVRNNEMSESFAPCRGRMELSRGKGGHVGSWMERSRERCLRVEGRDKKKVLWEKSCFIASWLAGTVAPSLGELMRAVS